MPYTHFRAIAYEVPTATKPTGGGDVISGWDPGPECAAVLRLPVPASVTNPDARNRLRRLAGVVNFAAEELDWLGDDRNTLKIFVVPEYYFRPPTAPTNTYLDLDGWSIIGALDQMFVHKDFRDWLFVCGTVLWNTGSDERARTLYWNTAVHVRGGRLQAAGIVEKQVPSDQDGIPLGPGDDDSDVKKIMESWWNLRQRVFTADGLSLGLEVCYDHKIPALKWVVLMWPLSEGGGTAEVGLHVLTAAGMTIRERSVAAKRGGYVLRNDGFVEGTPRSHLRKVKRHYRFVYGGGTEDSQLSPSSQAEMDEVKPEESLNLPEPLVLHMPGGYKVFDQRVVFYPPCTVPE
jgi:hypothetical protein